MDISRDDIVIVFMGATGTGKSTFVDLLVGQKGKRSGNDLESVTQEMEATRVIHPKNGKPVVFVDTPGFDDTYLTEGALLKRVADWLAKTYKAKVKLSGIIYLHCITDRRMGRSSLMNLSIFGRLCGETAMQGVVLVTTMWGDVKLEDGLKRETQLTERFWQPMIANGATVDRLQTTDPAEAWRIVDRLIDKRISTTLLVQEELVEKHNKLNQTQAGKIVERALEDTITNLSGQLKRLHDRKNATDNLEERRRIAKQIADLEVDYKKTKNDIQELGGRGLLTTILSQLLFHSRKKKEASKPPVQGMSTAPSTSATLSVSSVTNPDSGETMLKVLMQCILSSPPTEFANSDMSVTYDKAEFQPLAEYLDSALGEQSIMGTALRNGILTLLSKIAVTKLVYPRRVVLRRIKHAAEPIVEGVFGNVHKGLDRKSDVCIKRIKGDIPSDNGIKSYIEELILWSHLTHPNILPFYGFFFTLPNPYEEMCLVLPWISKGNLRSYTTGISQTVRMSLLDDVAYGLSYLHSLGVVHGDIKCENVLISNEGRALITDIGASHFARAMVTRSHGSTLIPIPLNHPLAAPEMYQDLSLRPTTASDIWSFGCLCYEVLSRRQPFDNYGIVGFIHKLCIERALPVRPRRGQADMELIDNKAWALIIACWILDPQKRPNCDKIRALVSRLVIDDNRPAPKPVEKPQGIRTVKIPRFDLGRAEKVLYAIQAAHRARLAAEENYEIL